MTMFGHGKAREQGHRSSEDEGMEIDGDGETRSEDLEHSDDGSGMV